MFERAAVRLYERLGWRVVLLCLGGGYFVSFVTVVITLAWLTRYLRASITDAVVLLAVCSGCVVAGCVIGAVMNLDLLRPLARWQGDGRNAENAPETWEILVQAPARFIRRSALAVAALMPALLVVTVSRLDLSVIDAVPVAGAIGLGILANVFLIQFAAEFVMRPMLDDISRYLPADFQPKVRTWRLATKALTPLPIVTTFAAVVVGAFVDLAPVGPGRLAVALGVAFVTVSVAAIIFVVITRSVLQPIDDLIAATRRIGAGDLSTSVPVVTADELGTLSQSFNRMVQEVRAAQARIVDAGDAERRRVERDLHDGAQQQLVLLNLKLGVLRRKVEGDPALVAGVDDMRADVARAMHDLRDLAHGIYPPLLVNDGLRAALADAAQRAAIPTTVDGDGTGRYPPAFEAAVYFCCMEALQNAAKHAGPGARATVRLGQREGTLVFEVADDGQGCDPDATRASTGIRNMADRVGALGGGLRIESAPGAGTRITGTVPLAT